MTEERKLVIDFTTLTLPHPKRKREVLYCPQISIKNTDGAEINFVADTSYESLEEANTLLAGIVGLLRNAKNAELTTAATSRRLGLVHPVKNNE